MKDTLYNTEEKRQLAISTFKDGINSPFWLLMVQILKKNKKFITKKILDGGDNVTKKQMDRLRDKLKLFEEVINTPKDQIEQLTTVKAKKTNLDPFLTAEEIKKNRRG